MLHDENELYHSNMNPDTEPEPISAEQVEQVRDPFTDPSARIPQAPVYPQQQSGSYYSPRSGYPAGGGYIPPTGGSGPQNGGSEDPAKKHSSHKGLKALGVFAAIAFISYSTIKCYQFANENETVRKFLGKNSSLAEELNLESNSSSSQGSSSEAETVKSSSDTESSVYTMKNWIDLAARKDSMTLPDIVDKVMPSSVGVSSTFEVERQSYSMWGYGQPQTYKASGTGTGIIMSDDGYIITNAHVIYDSQNGYGCAKEVQVVLNEDYYTGTTEYNATIVGYDTEEDIAVLKIDPAFDLVAAEFGNSDDLRVGELVVAIGNPLGFDLFGTVTTGIVSALNREVTINESTMSLIQTDTAINSGNSGGPLINSYGQVIGINSAKLSSSYGDSASIEGLCFAIPMSHAMEVVDDLINFGYVRGKPALGLTGVNVTEAISRAYGFPVGIYVSSVTEGGAAELAGIREGDVIIAINGTTVTNYEELNAAKDKYRAGDTITVTVTRSHQDVELTLILQERIPSDNN